MTKERYFNICQTLRKAGMGNSHKDIVQYLNNEGPTNIRPIVNFSVDRQSMECSIKPEKHVGEFFKKKTK